MANLYGADAAVTIQVASVISPAHVFVSPRRAGYARSQFRKGASWRVFPDFCFPSYWSCPPARGRRPNHGSGRTASPCPSSIASGRARPRTCSSGCSTRSIPFGGPADHPPVELDARLNAAAATHARDMSIQNRPWHFGSDGSSPIDRVRRVGYEGQLVGETISETYETELETLAAWIRKRRARAAKISWIAGGGRHGRRLGTGQQRQALVDAGRSGRRCT